MDLPFFAVTANQNIFKDDLMEQTKIFLRMTSWRTKWKKQQSLFYYFFLVFY